MVTFGDKMKIKVDRVLDNPRIRSTATLTPKTRTEGSYGGYEAPSEDSGTSSTIYVIPNDFVGINFLVRAVGSFSAGSVRLITKGSVSINKEDSIEWQGTTYDVEEVRPIIVTDVVVAKAISLSENKT